MEREQIRLSTLRYCNAAGSNALSENLLLQYLRSEGLNRLTLPDLQAELQYLADKTLIVSATRVLSPENKHWRITATGRDFVAETSGD